MRADQLAVDLGFVLGERLGQRLEAGLQFLVLGLRGQRLSPVQGEVEVAATIVDFTDLARRIAVELEELADGRVERLGKNLRLGVLVGLRQMFERRTESEILAERIPAEVVLFLELLYVLGAEPPAPVSKRPPPASSGTIDSILAEVPSSMIGNRSVR